MRSGEQCVMMDGLVWMPMLSVGNWDIHDTVSFLVLTSQICMSFIFVNKCANTSCPSI